MGGAIAVDSAAGSGLSVPRDAAARPRPPASRSQRAPDAPRGPADARRRRQREQPRDRRAATSRPTACAATGPAAPPRRWSGCTRRPRRRAVRARDPRPPPARPRRPHLAAEIRRSGRLRSTRRCHAQLRRRPLRRRPRRPGIEHCLTKPVRHLRLVEAAAAALARRADRRRRGRAPATDEFAGVRVLVAEDNPVNQLVAEAMLAAAACTSRSPTTGTRRSAARRGLLRRWC